MSADHESFSCLQSWGEKVKLQDRDAVVGHYAHGADAGATLWPTLSNSLRGRFVQVSVGKTNGSYGIKSGTGGKSLLPLLAPSRKIAHGPLKKIFLLKKFHRFRHNSLFCPKFGAIILPFRPKK